MRKTEKIETVGPEDLRIKRPKGWSAIVLYRTAKSHGSRVSEDHRTLVHNRRFESINIGEG
jgi:hypothetical protein